MEDDIKATLHLYLCRLRGAVTNATERPVKTLVLAPGVDAEWFDSTYGICTGVVRQVCTGSPARLLLALDELFEQWPEFSGDVNYPVPHPICRARWAYDRSDPAEMWLPTYPYGAARLRLLDWLIDQLSGVEHG